MPILRPLPTNPQSVRHAPRPVRNVRGFTAIELMITVVLLAVLITLAAPSMRDLVRDQRVKTATFDVYSSLAFARSEAIKRNADVHLCIASGSDWGAGWTVRIGAADCSGTPLKTQDPIEAINITGPASPVTYRGDGRLNGAAVQTFVLRSSQSNTTTARCVRVDLSGRPNIQVDTNKDPSDGCQT
jgi:type IV fimbrial biogenesis protein FimT